MGKKKEISASEKADLLQTLKKRFEQNTARHPDLNWLEIEEKLESTPVKLWSLHAMEKTGGEPDVVDRNPNTGEFLFFDCAVESPLGRRSLCYDRKALESRKENKPTNSAVDMVSEMGITLLTEKQYRYLQTLGKFDLRTSSWIETPLEIRKHGGSLFCDRRYDHVFTYHNGAQSYYAARGFRGALTV